MAKKDKNNSLDIPKAFRQWPEPEKTNIDYVIAIERLAKEMQENIKKLTYTTADEFEAIQDTREFLHLFQVNQVKKCRDMFE